MNPVQSKMHGLGVALVTPFNKQGMVDFPALQCLVEHQHNHGTGFLVVLGTTGETPTLSRDEQRRVVDFVLEVNAGRLPVVVGVTGNNTTELCERIGTWTDEGISGFLVASPAYNKPQQAGLVAHFEAVAEAAPRPVMLYNVPSRTGSNMTAETTLALAKHPNILGIKEASGDLTQIASILANRPDQFGVWSGDDALALSTLAMGAEGVISVAGNVLPERMSVMVQQAMFGQTNEAKTTHLALTGFLELLFKEGNPAGVKAAMEHLNLCAAHVRLPLVEASQSLKAELYQEIADMDVKVH